MLLDAFADLRRRDAKDIRIRQTELRPFDDALPLDFRIVFRMLRPVDGRRHKRIERMDETAVNDVAAPLRIRADGRAVHLVAHAELRRIVARIVRVALLQIRHENVLQVVQFHRFSRFRDERAVRREPTAAQIVVQQRIDGIQHAALSAAEQQCMVLRIAFHMDALQAELLIIDAEAVFFQQTAAAEEDRILLDIRLVRHDVEQLPRHFLKIIGKFFRGKRFRRSGLFRDDDHMRVAAQRDTVDLDDAAADVHALLLDGHENLHPLLVP